LSGIASKAEKFELFLLLAKSVCLPMEVYVVCIFCRHYTLVFLNRQECFKEIPSVNEAKLNLKKEVTVINLRAYSK
jgi:hypothetical protein